MQGLLIIFVFTGIALQHWFFGIPASLLNAISPLFKMLLSVYLGHKKAALKAATYFDC
ncbi:hypothetical protein [Shewanella pneumatophori]|uniref:Uncharacterized protein n=1 Tax=Shewanella pneumatophori TaxID=314092 RepID=A0A9X1ZFZ5_9GAMM|nr:hypothetical protein [Shewanella pneumatophori]MCL1137053.1 hypothetical protein [Shewanella pneumatophori]